MHVQHAMRTVLISVLVQVPVPASHLHPRGPRKACCLQGVDQRGGKAQGCKVVCCLSIERILRCRVLLLLLLLLLLLTRAGGCCSRCDSPQAVTSQSIEQWVALGRGPAALVVQQGSSRQDGPGRRCCCCCQAGAAWAAQLWQ
jgi:hypothetical protein